MRFIALVLFAAACSRGQPAFDGRPCFLIDPPPQGCACDSFYRNDIGSRCSPVGATCEVVQDQPWAGPEYQYTVTCGNDGHSRCESESCSPPVPDLATD